MTVTNIVKVNNNIEEIIVANPEYTITQYIDGDTTLITVNEYTVRNIQAKIAGKYLSVDPENDTMVVGDGYSFTITDGNDELIKFQAHGIIKNEPKGMDVAAKFAMEAMSLQPRIR